MRATAEAFGLFLCLLTIYLFALTFCGQPDLHDKLLKAADQYLEQQATK